MIKTQNLSSTLNVLYPAVQGNKIMPILSCIKMESIEKKNIKLTSSNLEMQISVSVDAKIDDNVNLCINYDKLNQFSRSNKDVDIEILDAGKDKIKLKSNSTSTINTFPPNAYPDMVIDNENSINLELDTNEFQNALNSISYSAGINDIRPFLHGVNFELKNQILKLTCSDGHRLATTSIYVDCDYDLEISCVIPIKTAQTLAKTFSNKEGKLLLSINKNSFSANNETTNITGKNIDAVFPNFSKLFELERLNHAIVDNKLLINGIESVLITAREISTAIVLTFESDNIHVVAENQNGEISIADIKCIYTGNKIEFGLSANYLIESAKKINGDISINLDDDTKNITLIENGIEHSAMHLIMQLKL